MILRASVPQRHSAEVQITLAVNGTTLPAAQLGPDFVILENPPALSPQPAEITLTIDGQQRRRQVHLLDGIPAHAASPAIVRIGPVG